MKLRYRKRTHDFAGLLRVEEARTRILIVSPDDEFRKRICRADWSGRRSGGRSVGRSGRAGKTRCPGMPHIISRSPDRGPARRRISLYFEQDHPDLDVRLVDSRSDFEALLSFASELDSGGREVERHRTSGAPQFDAVRVSVASRVGSAETVRTIVERLPGMLISRSEMQDTFRLARMVAKRNTLVLITGETGTGKELVAQAIHKVSLRVQGPFVVVNCAAIPETLLESELFGYVRGAFTGATQSRIGRIHGAHGGTLFLDEVGELPLSMQAKLLRFLQHGEVQRLGSSDVFQVDVRVIAATNVDLAKQVAHRQFRGDLYYRLAVFRSSCRHCANVLRTFSLWLNISWTGCAARRTRPQSISPRIRRTCCVAMLGLGTYANWSMPWREHSFFPKTPKKYK